MSGHVIVTGAAGLLGSHVAAAFREARWRVTALDIAADRDPDIVRADLTGLEAARAHIRDAD